MKLVSKCIGCLSVESKIAKSGYEEGFLIVTFYIKSKKKLKGTYTVVIT